MKKTILLFFLILFTLCAKSQGVDFIDDSFTNALAKAKDTKKLVFVDCYTTWCGPCRRLAKEVFPQKSVGDYFSKTFVALQMDMEKGEGVSYRKNWDVNAFPTLIVFDADGKERGRALGFFNSQQLIDTLRKIVSRDVQSEAKSEYEKGVRSTPVIKAYVDELVKEGKENSAVSIVSDFLNANPSRILSDSTAYALFCRFVTDPHTPCFLWAYSHKDDLMKAKGKESTEKMENVWRFWCKQTYNYDGQNFKGYDLDKMRDYETFMKSQGVENASEYTMAYKLPCSYQMGDSLLLTNLEQSATMTGIPSSQWHYFADQMQKRNLSTTMLKRLENAIKLRKKTDTKTK